MRKRPYIYLMIVLSMITIACLINRNSAVSPKITSPATLRYRLIWNDDPGTTMTIAWDQLRGKDAMVYYGEKDHERSWKKYSSSAQPTRSLPGYRGMNTQFAKLDGLKPDHIYYFVIKNSEGCSERYWFRTAPDTPKPFTFITGGDTKSEGTALQAGRASKKMVAKLRPLFVIINGDFTSGDGTSDERWQLWLDDWFALTTTDDHRMIPIVPVHGNHENGDKAVLHHLFDAPSHNNAADSVYYSLSLAGRLFHMILLNSEIEEGGSQRRWLEKDLQTHQDYTFKLAAYHKPFRPHTAGKKNNDYQYDQWAALFYRYGLNIGLEADSHMHSITYPVRPSIESGSYEGFVRDDETGIMFLGEGSWGAAPRDNNDDKPWTLESGSFNQIKWLHVFPETATPPAHINIHTVITATFDEDENITTYADQVVPLTEGDLFKMPEGIYLFAPEPHGAVITYPYRSKIE